MKIRLKAPEGLTTTGIYGKDGVEMPVGHEMTVKEEPKGWAGRYDILSSGSAEGKTAVTNPAKQAKPAKQAGDDDPKAVAEVLAMGADSDVQFMTFKAAAAKLLGGDTPATKAEIITALEELATKP